MLLHNKLNKEELIKKLEAENFTRSTISFYRYVKIKNVQEFRDNLYITWDKLNCLGRIYVANEGINAQMSVPNHNLNLFIESLNAFNELKNMPIKYAVENNNKSFYKLIIKTRKQIVADGINDSNFDPSNVGAHLTAEEFHNLANGKNAFVVDMRNHYESEIGKFANAYCPDADTFKDAIKITEEYLQDKKDKKILLYCTGGIRCEKASAYLKHKGFKDVNQLYGGIIEYAAFVQRRNIPSKFRGKNFVFDNRLGESINGEIIAQCHQCGSPCDNHTNCANDDCHLLFIQCEKCKAEYNGCCSSDCKDIASLDEDERKKYRQLRHKKYSESKIFRSRLKPKLRKETQTERV